MNKSKVLLASGFVISTISITFLLLTVADGELSLPIEKCNSPVMKQPFGMWSRCDCVDLLGDFAKQNKMVKINRTLIIASRILAVLSVLATFGGYLSSLMYFFTSKRMLLVISTVFVCLASIFHLSFMSTYYKDGIIVEGTGTFWSTPTIGWSSILGWILFAILLLLCMILVYLCFWKFRQGDDNSRSTTENNLGIAVIILSCLCSALGAVTVAGKSFSFQTFTTREILKGGYYGTGLWNICQCMSIADILEFVRSPDYIPSIDMDVVRSVQAFSILSAIAAIISFWIATIHYFVNRLSLTASGISSLLAALFEMVALSLWTSSMKVDVNKIPQQHSWAYALGWSSVVMFVATGIVFLKTSRSETYKQFLDDSNDQTLNTM